MLDDFNDVDQALTASGLNANNNAERTILNLPMSRIKLDLQNVRNEYDQDHIESLAKNIAENGLLQPISVRKSESSPGEYIINYGHYRYLAHQLLNAEFIEGIIDDDLGSVAIKLTENLIKKDMTILEVSKGLHDMMEIGLVQNPEYNMDDIAKTLGKSRTWVSRRMQVLNNEDYIQVLMTENIINDAETSATLNTLYLKFPQELKAKVADHEGVISSKLARIWSKDLNAVLDEQKQKNLDLPTEQPIVIEAHPKIDPQETKNLQSENTQDDDVQSKDVEQVEQSSSNKKSKKTDQQDKEQSLQEAYIQGVLESYKTILTLTKSDDVQLVALAKHVLMSFETQDKAANFALGQLIQYPNLLDEVTSILQSMAMIKTFIGVDQLKETAIDVILNQQDLILKS